MCGHSLQWSHHFRQTEHEQTTQQQKRVLYTVSFAETRLPFLFIIFKKLHSITVYYWNRDTPNPSVCMRGSCLGHWSYLFPSDILSSLCSVLCLQPQPAPCPLSKISKWDSTIEKIWKKMLLWPNWREGQDINKANQNWSHQKRFNYNWRINDRKVDLFYWGSTRCMLKEKMRKK